MPSKHLSEVLRSHAAARPAILEGHWVGQNRNRALVATQPASVLAGGSAALAELPAWLAWHAEKYPGGAAIGFFSYELVRFFESLLLPTMQSLPDLSFAYYPRIKKIPCSNSASIQTAMAHPGGIWANFSRKTYCAAVTRIRDYIAAGDVYQANLTQQFTVSLGGQLPERIYDRLSHGRAPFRAFLQDPARTIISNSPERFFRVWGGRILASPIKGTIRRGRHAAEDQKRTATLLASTKDRAENVMIVDLLRNDLGRICHYDSIKARLFEVNSLPHLFHLVSHVWGTLRPEVDVLEILRALFPCGSVTGAPKIRAMEILSEIENVPRGVSMGAIGIIVGLPGSNQFEMDFNVAIRTMMIQDNLAVFNAGGGIVYDSKGETEYEEMMLKARPLLAALGVVGSTEASATPAHVGER